MEKNLFLAPSIYRDVKIDVKYINYTGKPVSLQLPLYEDDSVKDILLRMAKFSNESAALSHVCAWYKNGSEVIPFGFTYPSQEVKRDSPFSLFIDPVFVNSEGDRLFVPIDTSTSDDLLESFSIKTLYFTTLGDFYKSLGINISETITDDVCISKVGKNKKILYNGLIRKFWPTVSIDESFNLHTQVVFKKIENETKVTERVLSQLDMVKTMEVDVEPIEIIIHNLALTHTTDTTVHLLRLFSDIKLGEIKDSVIPFSKITFDEMNSTYCKLLKEACVHYDITDEQYITQEQFISWTKYRQTLISGSCTVIKYFSSN